MLDLIISAIIVFAASTLQACTGFGFSVLATPFLLLVYEPHVAIQINIILSLLISIVMLPRVSTSVDRDLTRRLIIGSAIGAVPGILIFLFLDTQALRIAVSIIILVLTALLILKVTVRKSPRKDNAVGGVSGLLTASIGMPGPPLLLYFSGAHIDKAVLRSTTLAYFLFIYGLALILQITFGSTGMQIWLVSAAMAPITLAGVFLGQWLFFRINQTVFRNITYVILIVTGGYLLATSL